MNGTTAWRTGLSSYAYRWSGSSETACGADPMDARALIARAVQLGLQGVQLCENMSYHELSPTTAKQIAASAADIGIFIETGARGADPDYLARMIVASRRLGSHLLRIVAEVDRNSAAEPISQQLSRMSDHISAALRIAREEGIRLALENHATLCSQDLLHVLRQVGDDSLGICMDTMNSVTFLERPLDTARTLAPYTLCIHLKDFIVQKRPDDFAVLGVPLGEGIVDVPAVLRTMDHHRVRPSLHLELYVGRKADWRSTRTFEDECVCRSATYLKKVLAELEHSDFPAPEVPAKESLSTSHM